MKGGDKHDLYITALTAPLPDGKTAEKNKQKKTAVIGDTVRVNNHRFDYLDVYSCETASFAKNFLQMIARQNAATSDGLKRVFPTKEQFLADSLRLLSKKVKQKKKKKKKRCGK